MTTNALLLLILGVQILILFASFIFFAISTATDILIFKKLFRTRVITTENNGELHKLCNEVDQLKHRK